MTIVNLNFITQRRKELGYNLQEMASSLGFKHASTYMKYEKGEFAFKANHLPLLAKKLNCSIESLFF